MTQTERRLYHQSFTLVELLVIILFIGILIWLLLPILNDTREKKNRIGCASNLRQIGIAMLAYAGDNGNHLPHAIYNTAGDWSAALTNGYVQNPKIFRCPDDTFPRAFCFGSPQSYAISEGYDGDISIPWVHGCRLTCRYLTDSSSIAIVTEGWVNWLGNGPRCVGSSGYAACTGQGVSFAYIASSHKRFDVNNVATYSKSTHYLFLDGHVEWVENPSAARLAQMFPSKPAGASVANPPCP